MLLENCFFVIPKKNYLNLKATPFSIFVFVKRLVDNYQPLFNTEWTRPFRDLRFFKTTG